MAGIISSLKELSPLDDVAKEDLLNTFQFKMFLKGSFILKEGRVCNHLFFIESGLIKIFAYENDKEFVMKFFNEKMFFSEPQSYFSREPSKFMILALEDTLVFSISSEDIGVLCKKHHSIEKIFSKIYQRALLDMSRRISELLEGNATERYRNFVRENFSIIQRISLGDQANYLGITQGSLSRIRAQK